MSIYITQIKSIIAKRGINKETWLPQTCHNCGGQIITYPFYAKGRTPNINRKCYHMECAKLVGLLD